MTSTGIFLASKNTMASTWATFSKVFVPNGDMESVVTSDCTWQLNVVQTGGAEKTFKSKTVFVDTLSKVLGALLQPDQNYAQQTLLIDEESKVVILAWQAKDYGSSTDIYFFDNDFKLRRLQTNMASCPLDLCQ
eukprot:CAMPEP_0171216422 /NCGR_PEP_ID=MMETSP0790-20130122/32173_1 /TAXON_ID=2925 /ORGANISM="Alexandrium catenella, Strain OF101" /LENGTH=133 /DNA_ID=CAMNT_0011682203 /DNA_START=275 /DNA_END=676 /DNA_ORIENTATION=+